MAGTCLLPDALNLAVMAVTKIMNKVIHAYVSALALKCLHKQNKCTRVHCPRMLMWCSLLLLAVITAINMHAVHVNLPCTCLQTREILLDRSYAKHTCDAVAYFKFKLNCTILCHKLSSLVPKPFLTFVAVKD